MNQTRYQLVKDELSHDTIECIDALRRQAMAGQIIGLAFVAIRPRTDEGIVHTCGAAMRRRTLTRGLLRDLDDELRREHH